MILKKTIIFIAFFVGIAGVLFATKYVFNNDSKNVVMSADTGTILFEKTGEQASVTIDESDGKLYSLSREKPSKKTDKNKITIWIE